MIQLKTILSNTENPRFIEEEKLQKLMDSIKAFPKMMELRPMVVDKKNVVLGGNMRLSALHRLGYTEVPNNWVKKASQLTEEEKKRFVIADNVGFGEWDWEILESEWNVDELKDWGLEKIDWEIEEEKEKEPKPEKNFWVPDCLFESNNEYDIPTLTPQKQARLHLPFTGFGSEKRHGVKGIGTYHFYVDDYRFQKIWDDPSVIITSGAGAVCEPNLSLFDTTPIAYGLHLIYKKRWITRYVQSFGVEVFVDLNVSKKFYPYALIGVPEGWGQYITRGYADRIEDLVTEYEMAKAHHNNNKDSEFTFVCYGGGKEAKKKCQELNVVFVEQFMVNQSKKIKG